MLADRKNKESQPEQTSGTNNDTTSRRETIVKKNVNGSDGVENVDPSTAHTLRQKLHKTA